MSEQSSPQKSAAGPLIRFRLIQLDTVYVPPSETSALALKTSPFLSPGQQLYKAPVVRIFGATPAGQRVVAHVHGAMPYFYVQYEASLDPDTVHNFIRRLGAALNYATAGSLGRVNTNVPTDRAKHQYVAYIALCKGIPFYGFHVGYRYFLKIYCFNPRYKNRMAELLRTGKVMSPYDCSRAGETDKVRTGGFKVFEEHVPFHLQFMLDHNLYGCGWVELSECLFRRPLPESHVTEGTEDPIYLMSNVLQSQLAPADLAKSSHCPLELDCTVSSILNRHSVKERQLHQNFVEFSKHQLQDNAKLVQSVKEYWEDECKRRQQRDQPEPEEVRESKARDYATGEQPQWFMEPTFRAKVEELIAKKQPTVMEKNEIGPTEPENAFKTFVKSESKLCQLIPTTFQAVKAIHITTWIKDEHEENPYGVWSIRGIGVRSGGSRDNDGLSKKGATMEFKDEAEVQLGIDIAAIQSQMEGYKDEGPEDDIDLVPNPALDPIDEDLDEPNWDEDDNPNLPGQLKIHAGASTNRTPTKTTKSKEIVSPFKGLRSPSKELQSPRKLKVDQTSLGSRVGRVTHEDPMVQVISCSTSSPNALKRERQEQDEGFYQPKAGKMMRFVERLQQLDTATNYTAQNFETSNKSVSFEKPSLEAQARSTTNRNPVLFSDEKTKHPNLTADVKSQTESFPPFPSSPSNQQNSQSVARELVSSPNFNSSFSSKSINVDKQAKMKLDIAILTQTQRSRKSSAHTRWWRYNSPRPSTDELTKSLRDFDLPMKIYQDPFYSDPSDVPDRKREYGGRQYTILGNSLRFIPEFEHAIKGLGGLSFEKSTLNVSRWEFATLPPTLNELRKYKTVNASKCEKSFLLVSQIEGPTQPNSASEVAPVKSKPTAHESQHMDVLAIEVHADSQNGRQPDPAIDPIKVLFYSLKTEREGIQINRPESTTLVGLIMVAEHSAHPQKLPKYAIDQCVIEVVDTEIELLNSLIDKLREWDPEVLTGFELESWSWGYVMRRGCELDFDLVYEFGRVRSNSQGRFAGKDDKWGYTHGSSLKVTGRHVLSIWRMIRSEMALNQYTFENIVHHVLRTRVPHYSFSTLAKWWKEGTVDHRRRVLLYYLLRVDFDIKLVDETEMISRNAEISRTLGVDFFSAISRGSQYKVESVLFRIAKPENYLLPSPTREEVGKQNAAECLPLVMEPQSAFYKSPLVVLDFQSLYPSIMIAYNYCYSTCLGRVNSFKGVNKLGTSVLELPDGLLKLMKDDIIISPNGMMFAKHQVRKSLLSKMLSEFLDTRVMIKQSMKFAKDDKALTKMLNARQLGLKFIANVMYGYTSASFSGRMPCVEIADAIVQTGRETLEKSMDFIHSVKEWDAKVVYGDTDSLFIYLPGRTKEEAFRIGNEMADAITKRNPAPVKLKFEKVYLPCVLMAKKRYVGAKFENVSDTKAVFDAKGIEVVRRDGIPALQKIQETCLKKLFETQDLSEIKAYLYRQWQRLLLGKVSIQDFTFAKEVKLGTYSEKGPPPPGALIAARKMAIDSRSEPVYAERVPYVIVKGVPQSRLRDRAVSPELLLQNRLLALDAEYYISRVFIPSLARIFNLIGVDVAAWYQSMPKMIRVTKSSGLVEHGSMPSNSEAQGKVLLGRDDKNKAVRVGSPQKVNKILVDEHFQSDRCLNCEEEGQQGILCKKCSDDPTNTSSSLLTKARLMEKRRRDIEMICRKCSSLSILEKKIQCDSLDCSVLYDRVKGNWMAEDSLKLINAVDQIEEGQNLNEVGSIEW